MATGAAEGSTAIAASKDGITGSTPLTVRATAADTTFPTATITSPANNSTLTSPVNVIGTASDANFLKYVLEVAPAGQTTFTTLASGTSPVVNGVLATFDPTLMLNGLYTVRPAATTTAGETSTTVAAAVDGRMKVGNFTLAFPDLEVPATATGQLLAPASNSS